MRMGCPSHRTDTKRAARSVFEELGTLCQRIVQLAGRLGRPGIKQTFILGANPKAWKKILEFIAV